MEKILKKVKVLIVILFVILISVIAFWGIFKSEKGVWRNVLPEYQYGMDIKGTRELRYVLDDSEEEKYVYVDENGSIKGEVWKDGNPTTEESENASVEGQDSEDKTNEENIDNVENSETATEETETPGDSEDSKDKSEEEQIPYKKETRTIKVNDDDKLNKKNFELSKSIIQKRLKEQKVSESNMRIDDVTGTLVIETKNDNDNIDNIEELISKPGKFQIIDYQNGLVLMDNSNIKNASVVTSNESSYKTYLQIEFNKEGSQKLKEISKKYVEIKKEEENSEDNSENEENTNDQENDITNENDGEEPERKYVSVVFDDTTMMTTYFGEEMGSGMLQISVGKERTEYDEFIKDYKSAKRIADTLNSGIIPVTYKLETDNFVESEITESTMKKIIIVETVIFVILSLIMIIKFKINGLLSSILGIGYIAVLSIVIRYTNVILTINSLVAISLMILMNYIYVYMFNEKIKNLDLKKAYQESMKEFYLKSIPICVIAIVFTLVTNLFINSIGTVVFWSIVLNALYNFVFTRNVLMEKNK